MMADEIKNEKALRQVRDILRAQLETLDGLGEDESAIEINSAIEILNARLGEPTSAEDIAALQRRYLAD